MNNTLTTTSNNKNTKQNTIIVTLITTKATHLIPAGLRFYFMLISLMLLVFKELNELESLKTLGFNTFHNINLTLNV